MDTQVQVPVMTGFPINEVKVIDKVIDVYLWTTEDLNTAEVQLLGQHLINLANRRATDVEAEYLARRQYSWEQGILASEEPDYDNEPFDIGMDDLPE